jgi:hypothetical protein
LTVQDFRSNPLPDRIIHALLSATQAYAGMDVLVNEYPEKKPILSHMLMSLDVYYQHYDVQPDIVDICHALFIPSRTSVIGRNITTFADCAAYAKNKVTTTEVLTAGDILSINRAIRTEGAESLLLDKVYTDCESLVKSIWPILHAIYDPQRQYPLLLEAAIAFYSFLTLSATNPFSMQTLTILLSTVYQNDFAFYGLLRQWVLFTDPRIHISSMDTVDALTHILEIFQGIWAYTVTLLRTLNHRKTEIINLIDADFSQQTSAGIGQILLESLCIRSRDVSDRLHLSPKTVTKHLKHLEQQNILHSVKHWRETLYFNNLMTDTLKEQIM